MSAPSVWLELAGLRVVAAVLAFVVGVMIRDDVPDWLWVILAITGVALIGWGAWDNARRLFSAVIRVYIKNGPTDRDGQ